MVREIKFGDRRAFLCIDGNSASITIEDTSLPVLLADALEENEDITISEVYHMKDFDFTIQMDYEMSKAELTNVICEALSQVYDTDTTVCYARSQNII